MKGENGRRMEYIEIPGTECLNGKYIQDTYFWNSPPPHTHTKPYIYVDSYYVHYGCHLDR